MQLHGASAVGPLAPQANSFRQCLTTIATQEGIRGFYKGLGPAMLLVSHGAIQMMTYEELKARRHATSGLETGFVPPAWSESLILGATSKLVASTCTYPLQVFRSRMQQRLQGSQAIAYSNLSSTFKSIVRRDGLKGMYKGFAANILRVCPQSALQFFFYENIRRLMGS